MLIKKIFYRELVSNASKIFVVLLFILPLTELFKLLEQAASGSISTMTFATLILYATIAAFPMVLNIACFLTLVITINRYCKEHEFAVWLSSGISPFYWLKQTTIFILPMAILCGICSMVVTPWAVGKADQYKKYMSKQALASFVTPGVFKESPDNKQVFYVENYSLAPSFAKRLFVQYTDEEQKTYAITAKAGKISSDNGVISVTLENGHRYELNGTSPNNIILNFNQFKASIKQNNPEEAKDTTLNVQTALMRSLIAAKTSTARAELSGRISVAIMTLLMALIALPISIQTGRVQNNLIFIAPPLIYAIYQNLVMTINDSIAKGILTSMFYIMPLHLFVLAVAIGLTYVKSKPRGYFWSKNK